MNKQRQWYIGEDGRSPDGLLARGMEADTRLYHEIIELLNAEGSNAAISQGVLLADVVEAVEHWFEHNKEEPYGRVEVLLTFDESDAVADAENRWFNIPGNSERRNRQWQDEYTLRLGSALTSLTESGYEADGLADRSAMKFTMTARHPLLVGDSALDRVIDAYNYDHNSYKSGFGIDTNDEGMLTVVYNQCPPSGSFEPIVKRLVSIVSS